MGARRAMIAAALVGVLVGCGPRAGSDATLESEPSVSEHQVIDSTMVYASEDFAKSMKSDGDQAHLVDNGTLVRVVEVRGDLAVVRIKEGRYNGEIGWVRASHLKLK